MHGTLAAPLNRDTALFDAYVGLVTIGYTRLGAMRALRTIGATFAEAKHASDTYDGKIGLGAALQSVAS